MAFGTLPKSTDTTPIPISSLYISGVGFAALQGSTASTTDGSGNLSTPANVVIIAPAVTTVATRSNVAGAASDTSLLASNTSRKGALFFNDSTAILYLAYGAGAATITSYTVQIPAGGFFELPMEPVFTGAIRGIWSAANGNVRITELT